MKLKKPTPIKAPASETSSGGATIADRFKINTAPQPVKKSSSSGIAAIFALLAGIIALGLTSALVWYLMQYVEYNSTLQ